MLLKLENSSKKIHNALQEDLQMVEGVSLLDVLGTLPKGSGSRTKKPSSTRKYICPKCGNSCRATKTINIICGDCMDKMIVAE